MVFAGHSRLLKLHSPGSDAAEVMRNASTALQVCVPGFVTLLGVSRRVPDTWAALVGWLAQARGPTRTFISRTWKWDRWCTALIFAHR